jgi:hypothetical protein
MTTIYFGGKPNWRVNTYWVFSGILLTAANTTHGFSCAPPPVLAPGQNQSQASAQQIATLTVRSRIADSALVMQGKIESISEDYASLNWAAARLAVVRPSRTFKGDASTKYEVLVPIDTQLGDEVVVFANLEIPKEVQLRVDWNSGSLKPNLKWTQSKNPLWVASAPCITRTYSIKKSPEIAAAIQQVFSASPFAELVIETRAYSPGSPYQTNLDEKITLDQKTFDVINAKGVKYSSQINKQLSAVGLPTTAIENIPEGRYVLSLPKINGMKPICNLDMQDFNCSSVEVKSYASHKLRIDYKPSAKISFNQVPDLIKNLPIEYEFAALDAGVNQPPKIKHISGVLGDSVFLYPGKYNLFAVVAGPTASQDRRTQITQNGNTVLRFDAGAHEISIATNEFIQPIETTIKWDLPSGKAEPVSTSFQLLANVNRDGRIYQTSAYSSCNSNECKLVALRGQSIEITATTNDGALMAKKALRVGDQITVNLTFAPIQK